MSGERLSNTETDLQRVQSILGKLGLSGQNEIALRFEPKTQDTGTGEWVPRIDPGTGRPIVMPALIPIERLDECPVPLATFSDDRLREYIETANTYRADMIPAEKEEIARGVGTLLLQQTVRIRNSKR